MHWIKGVDAKFGDCAFNVSSRTVITEYDNGGKGGTGHAVMYYQWKSKENLHDCL